MALREERQRRLLYYLNVQLGFSINQIIPNYNSNLASIYHALTGDTANPFPGLLGLLESAFPRALCQYARHRRVPGEFGMTRELRLDTRTQVRR